jgi:hypothetical protein
MAAGGAPLSFAAVVLVALAPPAFAGEGGASYYLQGAYNDFAVAVGGPSGFYLRTDLVYQDAGIGVRPLGGRISAGIDQGVWTLMAKPAWVSDIKIFGGTFGVAAVIPYALDANASLRASGPGFDVFREGDESGLADIWLTPVSLNWANGPHNTAFAFNVVVPTGKYDAGKAINPGRNYWAMDPTVSYTYLDNAGWDISATAGVIFNATNPDTDYRTGNEFHLDWLAGRHLSETFGVGLTGYWYQQFTSDNGAIPPGADEGFKGSGIGVGIAATQTVRLGATDVTFIGKWIHDLETENRMEGDVAMLSTAFKF